MIAAVLSILIALYLRISWGVFIYAYLSNMRERYPRIYISIRDPASRSAVETIEAR
jgi:hypothetical protein